MAVCMYTVRRRTTYGRPLLRPPPRPLPPCSPFPQTHADPCTVCTQTGSEATAAKHLEQQVRNQLFKIYYAVYTIY